jgi:hypothetical protein
LAGTTADITALAFSPDGRYASAGIICWSRDCIDFKLHLYFGQYDHMKDSISGSREYFICLYDTETGKEIWRQKIAEPVSSIWSQENPLGFSPDSRRILAVSRHTVGLFDAETGREVLRFEASSRIKFVAFSSDGRRILASSEQGIVYLWNAATGEQLLQLEGTSAIFSPDDQQILTADRSLLRLWDAKTGAEQYRIHPYRDGWLTLYPDGHYRCGGVERLALVRNGTEARPVDAEFAARWRLTP